MSRVQTLGDEFPDELMRRGGVTRLTGPLPRGRVIALEELMRELDENRADRDLGSFPKRYDGGSSKSRRSCRPRPWENGATKASLSMCRSRRWLQP